MRKVLQHVVGAAHCSALLFRVSLNGAFLVRVRTPKDRGNHVYTLCVWVNGDVHHLPIMVWFWIGCRLIDCDSRMRKAQVC